MMSNFHFCPMCGVKRLNNEVICSNCGFKYLIGKYVKIKNSDISKENINSNSNSDFNFNSDLNSSYEKSEKQSLNKGKINVEKISQEEVVEANNLIKNMTNKINESIDKCLNKLVYDLNECIVDDDCEIIRGKSISQDLNLYFSSILDLSSVNSEDIADDFYSLINQIDYKNDEYIKAQNTLIQWIDENRGHLPVIVLNNYKMPIQKNIDKLSSIISYLESVDSLDEFCGYDGLDKFISILKDYYIDELAYFKRF